MRKVENKIHRVLMLYSHIFQNPSNYDATGCAFRLHISSFLHFIFEIIMKYDRSPKGRLYDIVDKSSVYQDVSCLCLHQSGLDPRKTCGIVIENFKEEYKGFWT